MGSFNTKLEQPDMDQAKDGLRAMQGWLKAKLDTFELEVHQELSQTGGSRAVDIPIVSIIDRDGNLFVKDQQTEDNAISSSIQGAVGNLISGEWKPAITEILKGGLNIFLGPKQTMNEGSMQEHRSFHLVWADTALLRLDMYAIRFDVSTQSDYKKHAEFFAGYKLIKSIVDINKISPQILSYQIVNFLDAAGKSKDENGDKIYKTSPKAILMQQIEDCQEIFEGVSELLKMISEHQTENEYSGLLGRVAGRAAVERGTETTEKRKKRKRREAETAESGNSGKKKKQGEDQEINEDEQ